MMMKLKDNTMNGKWKEIREISQSLRDCRMNCVAEVKGQEKKPKSTVVLLCYCCCFWLFLPFSSSCLLSVEGSPSLTSVFNAKASLFQTNRCAVEKTRKGRSICYNQIQVWHFFPGSFLLLLTHTIPLSKGWVTRGTFGGKPRLVSSWSERENFVDESLTRSLTSGKKRITLQGFSDSVSKERSGIVSLGKEGGEELTGADYKAWSEGMN